jgi:signal transduction histidine kinase
MVKRATDQMERLIADLLDTSRMEAERFTIERSPESAAALVTAACEMMRPIAGAKNIALECDVQQDLPPIPVDARQILRVLGNLVSNAIKFSPARTTIRVHGEVRNSDLCISVRDSGEGIPPQQIDKVFDKFWTGREADRRGTGLGLAIAEGIVQAHGGKIWVESQPGAGSTFTFSLPVSATPASAAPAN